MDKALFSLAIQGLRRSKGKALRVLAVLAVSFGFALASLSLSASIQATNQEFAKNIYGEWYLGVLAAQERDGAWLSRQRWLIQLGTARPWGQVDTPTGPAALGTLDEGMRQVGRLRLSAGRWPQAEGELAAEAAVLAQLGLADPQPGQQLTLPVRLETESGPVTLYRTYTLCGVIQPYTDRWVLTENATGQLLVSLAVADPEARSLQREAGAAEPVFQYFMTVRPGGQDEAVCQLNEYLGWEKAPGRDDTPSVNHQVYTASTPPSDPVLAGIMGLTALAAVLCIQVMQLPEQVRRFATLRSLGMTWGQGAALSLWEALLLAVPAVVLGLPLAGAVVWTALRAVVFAGPMPFTVVLPGRSMLAVALLWLGLYAAARLSVVWAAWRTPLVGQFQLPAAARRRLRWARQGLIACLLLGFGVTVIHTEMQAVPHWERRETVRQQPHYDLSAQEGLLTDSQLAQLRQLPGMLESLPVSRSYVGLEYPGLAEHRARLVVVETAAPWADVLDFGPDAAAFDAGQQVLLCFPSQQVPDQMLSEYHTPGVLLAPGEDISNRDYPLPDAEVQLHFYSGQGEALACRSAGVRVCRLGPEPGPESAGSLYRGVQPGLCGADAGRPARRDPLGRSVFPAAPGGKRPWRVCGRAGAGLAAGAAAGRAKRRRGGRSAAAFLQPAGAAVAEQAPESFGGGAAPDPAAGPGVYPGGLRRGDAAFAADSGAVGGGTGPAAQLGAATGAGDVGGQQQRAAIARSVLAKPELIIADEPTGNLDKKTGEETMALLTGCAARFGQTLILVTHNPEIAAMAQQVLHIEDGRLV